MKKFALYATSLFVSWICISALWAQDSQPQDPNAKAKIDAFYEEFNQTVANKNLEAMMDMIAPEFSMLGGMGGKDVLRTAMQSLFAKNDKLRNTVTVITFTQVDSNLQIAGEANLESQKKGETQWSTVVKSGFIDILKEFNGKLKLISSGQIDLDRMKNINDTTYADQDIGYSFSVPTGWKMFPISLPTLQGSVMMMMPDGHCPGFFGHVQIPYKVSVKQAIEGDDAVMKKLMKTFKVEKSAPITIKGMEGHESLTRYTPSEGEEQTRHRIYLSGGGLLYVFIMNAPTKHWESVQDKLMEIINTFTLTPDAKKSGASRLREKSSTGEIMDRIYSNKEFGCQIAAPKDWTITSTPLGSFKVSISIKPPQGDSLVRLMATETKGMIDVKDIFEQEMNGIKAITEDFSVQEEAKDIELVGTTGRTAVFTFKLEGLGTVQRKSVMIIKNDILYMILCDAIPPEKTSELKSSFDAIIQSFTVN